MAANVEILHPRLPALDGYIDTVADGRLYGWAWDRERPGDRLEVQVKRGDAVLVKGPADRPRSDLAASGIGDGGHAFELALPDGTDINSISVVVVSPTTGDVSALRLRQVPQLDDVPEELQRVTATVHSLSVVQKQTAGAILEALKEIRDSRRGPGAAQLAALEEAVAQIAAGQQSLQKRFETVEVFLLRFDTLLRQFDEKVSAGAPDSSGDTMVLRRVAAGLGAVTVAAIAAVFVF